MHVGSIAVYMCLAHDEGFDVLARMQAVLIESKECRGKNVEIGNVEIGVGNSSQQSIVLLDHLPAEKDDCASDGPQRLASANTKFVSPSHVNICHRIRAPMPSVLQKTVLTKVLSPPQRGNKVDGRD